MAKPVKNDTAYLLEKAALLVSQVGKKIKDIEPCKTCGERKSDKYQGICTQCRNSARKDSGAKREGLRWTGPDGYEKIYDSDGKPQLYARYRMAQLLQRELRPGESVTYKDLDRRNTADDNLVLVTKGGIPVVDMICPHCGKTYIEKEETNEN